MARLRLTPNQEALLALCASPTPVSGASLRNARILEGLGLVKVSQLASGEFTAKQTAEGAAHAKR